MRELVDGADMTCLNHLFILLFELFHGCRAGTRSTLIRSDMNLLDMAQFVNRIEHDNHHNRGTVRVGDDAFGTVERILGVDLRHHERHLGIHAPLRTVVNHHGAIFCDRLSKLGRCAATRRDEGDVHILEVVVVLQLLHRVSLATERILTAGTALRAEEQKVIDWELSLSKDTQELLPYRTACAYNSNSHNDII